MADAAASSSPRSASGDAGEAERQQLCDAEQHGDLVLSEVHMHTRPAAGGGGCVTRFRFRRTAQLETQYYEQDLLFDEQRAYATLSICAAAGLAPEQLPEGASALKRPAAVAALTDADGDFLDLPRRRPRHPGHRRPLDSDHQSVGHQPQQQRLHQDEHEDDGGQQYDERCSSSSSYINIGHQMATPLDGVGLQVWRGACRLAGFVLQRPQLFCGATVVELGAGTGLAGLVASALAARVFITDAPARVLQLAAQNVERNRHLLRLSRPAAAAQGDESGGSELCDVVVRRLDFLNFLGRDPAAAAEVLPQTLLSPPAADASGAGADGGGDSGGVGSDPFGWRPADLQALRCADVLLAADVIYDETLTEAFLACASTLLEFVRGAGVERGVSEQRTTREAREATDGGSISSSTAGSRNNGCRLYVSLEKRYAFTLRDMRPAAPAFEHFVSCLGGVSGTCQSSAATADGDAAATVAAPAASPHQHAPRFPQLMGRRLDVASVSPSITPVLPDDQRSANSRSSEGESRLGLCVSGEDADMELWELWLSN